MEKSITKLIKVLDNNKNNNMLILGTDGNIFEDAIIIPSTLPSGKLGIGIDDNGKEVYPSWLEELKAKENEEKILLVIDCLEKVSEEEQNKFYGLLKYKGINGYKFPDNTQIVCTSKKSDTSKISEKILSLMLIYKM